MLFLPPPVPLVHWGMGTLNHTTESLALRACYLLRGVGGGCSENSAHLTSVWAPSSGLPCIPNHLHAFPGFLYNSSLCWDLLKPKTRWLSGRHTTEGHDSGISVWEEDWRYKSSICWLSFHPPPIFYEVPPSSNCTWYQLVQSPLIGFLQK